MAGGTVVGSGDGVVTVVGDGGAGDHISEEAARGLSRGLVPVSIRDRTMRVLHEVGRMR